MGLVFVGELVLCLFLMQGRGGVVAESGCDALVTRSGGGGTSPDRAD